MLIHTLISAGTHLISRHATTLWSPLLLVSVRTLLAALVFLVVLRVVGGPLVPPRASWGRWLVFGFLVGPLNQGLFIFGLARSRAVHAALLYALTPLFVYLLGVVLGRERLRAARVVGIVLALSGVGVLLWRRGFGDDGLYVGDLMLLGAVCAWAAWTVLSRPASLEHGGFRTAAWSIILAAAWMIPVAPFAFDAGALAAMPAVGFAELGYLVLVTSVLSYVLWNFALARTDASRVAVFANLQPVLTALGAWALLGEPLGWEVLVAGALVLAGVRVAQTPG